MNGMYTETCIKRNMTFGLRLAKAGMIILGIVLLLGGFFIQSGILSFLGIAALVGFYFLLPMFNVDWEYIFCDGQIDFDRISGGEKRKTMLKIDMDNIDIMAPEKSHELDNYRNRQGIVTKDFSSKNPDARRYVIYTTNKNEQLKIIFEPSDTMIDFAKQKAPRKVFKD